MLNNQLLEFYCEHIAKYVSIKLTIQAYSVSFAPFSLKLINCSCLWVIVWAVLHAHLLVLLITIPLVSPHRQLLHMCNVVSFFKCVLLSVR